MVRLTAQTKRAKLNAIAIGARASATPLIGALQSFLLTQDAAYGEGRAVIAHAGAGKNTQLHDWSIGEDRQPGEFMALAQEFLEMYSDAVGFLLSTYQITAPPSGLESDPDILALMFADDRMADITKTQPDFTTLLQPWR